MNNSLMERIAERLKQVQAQIAAAAQKSSRSPDDIELVAVSKMHPAETVQAAVDAGQIVFGESRVQEARAKIPLLPSRLRWHFIGHLQKNKIRHALPLFELFHGIDSLALAQDLERIADEEGSRPRILLEINLAAEASKHGFAPEILRTAMEELLSLGKLSIEGLMAIPPIASEPESSRPYFIALRKLRDELESRFNLRLPQLSMGMSSDYLVAIEEGATLVRVGTAIFGERQRTRPQ
jgi:pyridoxal phosphate enzyme (YggS family)